MVGVVKQAMFNAFGKMGYEVVPTWRMERYAEAVFLRRLFHLLQIDCVVDVGANLGQYHDFLRKHIEFTGDIISFEPIPNHVEFLRQRAKADSRWHIQSCALGSEVGRASFNVMARTAFSSFLQPDHSNVPQFKDINEVEERVEVEVSTLDRVLPQIDAARKAQNLYLKLDTQGFDLQVVKGATASIGRVKALQTEASVRPIYSGMPDYVTTIQTLQSLGFEPSGFFAVSEDQFPLLVEFDCYMVAKSYLATSSEWRGAKL